MTTTRRFRIEDPLPVGRTTLLEASAGTGKTYTLAALATRFVAEEGIPIARVLLVTFTRAATAELRDRIRRRLVEAAAHLSDPQPTDDVLLEHLSSVDADERTVRRQRLLAAVRDFDTATITTIHGFCSQVRMSRGVLADQNVDAVPAESEAQLIQQVCADLIFARAAGSDEPLELPSVESLVAVVAKARTLGACVVQAESGRAPDLALVELVEQAVRELEERMQRTGAMSFDSLLTSVRDAVRSDPVLVGDLRQQFQVALIDEFQDTDPVQWEIFRTLFDSGSPRPTLVMVGDPKQAIYAFRGGDVYTYLDARAGAEVMALGTNQRSDRSVVEAMNITGAGQSFGEEAIVYQQVESAERHAGRRLFGSDGSAAPGLVVRCLVDPKACGADGPKITSDLARRRIAADLADTAAQLLTGGHVEHPDGSSTSISPDDIAVLVGSRFEAAPIARALRERAIPVVLRLGDNVAESAAADQWRTLLFALERPADSRRAAAAALTWFFDWTPQAVAEAVADADERSGPADALVDVQHRLVAWADVLTQDGVAELFGELRRSTDLVSRLLMREAGERNLTDLEHLTELLHAEARDRGLRVSATAALAILDELGGTAGDELAADAVQRRVESEADAVQIMTIHGAKGLEFPIVLLPGLWSGGQRVQARGEYSYFDRRINRRVLDVSTKQLKTDDQKERSRSKMAPHAAAETTRQNCGDQHRMTYVAMTRAVHQTVVWWSVGGQSANLCGLGRLLFGATTDLAANDKVVIPSPESLIAELQERFDGVDALRVDEVVAPTELAAVPSDDAPTELPELRVAELGRDLPRATSRWSFSSMKNVIRSVGSTHGSTDPTVELADDARAGDEGDAAPGGLEPTGHHDGEATGQWNAPTMFEGLGAGTDFGNLVHDLFEHVDFTSEDLEGAFSRALDPVTRSAVTDEQRAQLPKALAEVSRTPLGRHFGDVRLADLDGSRRLNELAFFLPLAPRDPLRADAIGRVVSEHLDDAHPLREWAERLASGLVHIDLSGYLNGSIDLILRYDVDGVTKYSVVDYKTNRLTPRGQPGTIGDYHPDQLHDAMAHHHYALQSLLYSVALHRYLRWRIDDYDPQVHLGPVGYLFVRGMVGSATPIAEHGPNEGVPAGVFTWQLPAGLVEALSQRLAGADRQMVRS